MKSRVLLLCSAFALAQFARAATRPFDYEVAPTLLNGNSFSDITLGVDYNAVLNLDWADEYEFGNFDGYINGKLDGELAIDPDLARKPLVTEFRAGFSRHWVAAPPLLAPGVIPPPGAAKMQEFGILAGGLTIRHETDQRFNEQNLVAGAELSYINIKDEDFWSYVPSVVAALDYVYSAASDVRNDAGVDDKSDLRIRIEASLKSSFGKQVFDRGSFFEPLGLRLDFRHHRLLSADSRLDDTSTYGAAALTYTLAEQGGHWKHTTLFIRLSDGRIPPVEQDETVLAIGATNPW